MIIFLIFGLLLAIVGVGISKYNPYESLWVTIPLLIVSMILCFFGAMFWVAGVNAACEYQNRPK